MRRIYVVLLKVDKIIIPNSTKTQKEDFTFCLILCGVQFSGGRVAFPRLFIKCRAKARKLFRKRTGKNGNTATNGQIAALVYQHQLSLSRTVRVITDSETCFSLQTELYTLQYELRERIGTHDSPLPCSAPRFNANLSNILM